MKSREGLSNKRSAPVSELRALRTGAPFVRLRSSRSRRVVVDLAVPPSPYAGIRVYPLQAASAQERPSPQIEVVHPLTVRQEQPTSWMLTPVHSDAGSGLPYGGLSAVPNGSHGWNSVHG